MVLTFAAAFSASSSSPTEGTLWAQEKRGQVIDSSQRGDVPQTEAIISPRLSVKIQGALVLPPEVYLEILDLPSKAKADTKTAMLARKQVLEFLRRAGYELASLKVTIFENQLIIDVDEGQIERVVFLGPLSYQQMRFKLGLQLPNDVFNRSHFEQQVRELSEALKVTGVRWELVRTAPVKHVGPQLGQIASAVDDLVQAEWVARARRPYEVRVYFPENTLSSTLGLELRTDFLDGLQLGLTNPVRDLFKKGDLLRMQASGGIGLRRMINTLNVYPHFSRANVSVGYDTVPLLQGLRASAVADGNWVARQRSDLNLENYNAVTATGGAQLNWDVGQALRFTVGGGVEWRRLFGFSPVPGLVPLENTPLNQTRAFVRSSQEIVFDPSILRWQRRHSVEAEIRQYIPTAGQQGMGFVDVRYQYVREFGWNDLWVKSRARVAWGQVIFHDERSVGEFLRALFGYQFVPSAVNLQLEFRFAVARDLLKLSLFHDLALLVDPARVSAPPGVRLANGFGPGVHILAWDMFQVDSYLAFGFGRGGQFSVAYSLGIAKAF